MSDEPDGLPYPLALIACDHVHLDPVGLTKSLLGVFVHRRAEAFPTEIPLHFYFSFTEARKGLVPVRLRLAAPGDRCAALLDVNAEMDHLPSCGPCSPMRLCRLTRPV